MFDSLQCIACTGGRAYLATRMRAHATNEDLEMRLRSAGLSRTRTRIAVLHHLREVTHPATHAETVRALGIGFDRVSIYRALTDLTRVGLLARVDNGDHVWRFSLVRHDRTHCLEHPHVVCV